MPNSTFILLQISINMAERDEHVIKCSICSRGLIVKDTINNVVAFLSHLKIDHGITYIPQRMTEEQTKSKRERNQVCKSIE
jgi:hypothetical protein